MRDFQAWHARIAQDNFQPINQRNILDSKKDNHIHHLTTSSARPMNISTHSAWLSPQIRPNSLLIWRIYLIFRREIGGSQRLLMLAAQTMQSCIQAAPLFWVASHSTLQWTDTSQHKLPATHFPDKDRPYIIFFGRGGP
jgi:hypothetical protein